MTMMNYVSNLFFYLTLLFLPTQLGKHFWPDFSVVTGIRVDYLSPTIYVTDILIFLLFLTWFFNTCHAELVSGSKYYKNEMPKLVRNDNIKTGLKNYWKLVIFIVFLITGILYSKSPILGFYGLLKLMEFGFFGFYVAFQVKTQKTFALCVFLFAIGIILESVLAIAHYVNQGSIGGVLYFLGEREFSQTTPGIANASLNGELVLRPYGTFSHPNVLAGYLAIAMAIASSKLKVQSSKLEKTIYGSSILLGTVALFLTMSRVAILVWIGFLIMFFLKKIKLKFKFLIGTIMILILLNIISFSLFPQRFTNITLTDESFQIRWKLIEDSFTMIKNNPVFGVGLNNFLINTVSYLQPVHNIYLLITSQAGVVGLLIFLWFIRKTFGKLKAPFGPSSGRGQNSKLKNLKVTVLSIVLILGLFDHYSLTLQQGQLLFAFVLGLCWSRSL